MLTDNAVVRDVHIGHDEGVASYLGHTLAACLCTAVDGCTFADGHIVTDFDICNLAVELEVLRDGADYRSRENRAVPAHLDIFEYDGMRKDLAAITDFDIVIDVGVRTDFNVVSELCVRAHCRQWRDFVHIAYCFYPITKCGFSDSLHPKPPLPHGYLFHDRACRPSPSPKGLLRTASGRQSCPSSCAFRTHSGSGG